MARLDEQDFTLDSEFLRDNDSLYVLPLRLMPLDLPALRRARLIKTSRLEPAIEMFRTPEAGCGYLPVRDIVEGRANGLLNWKPGEQDADENSDALLLSALGRLTSFDVYNLRVELRKMAIDYEGIEYLDLSDEMKDRLSVYMRQFTLPLIGAIYGNTDISQADTSEIISLFRQPRNDQAAENLRRLASRLRVDMADIPRFLEQYADIYLAVSYYQHYANEISQELAVFFEEVEDVQRSLAWRDVSDVNAVCAHTRVVMQCLMMTIFKRLDRFREETRYFWDNINAERYRGLQSLVGQSQSIIAGILCGLGIKLSRWRERFPMPEYGNAQWKFHSLQLEIRPGLCGLMDLTGEPREELSRLAGLNVNFRNLARFDESMFEGMTHNARDAALRATPPRPIDAGRPIGVDTLAATA